MSLSSAASSSPPSPKRVAVIGGGAAGLVVARFLRDAEIGHIDVLEKTDHIGGVWKYRPKDVIYRSLVTNLPKEIMAYFDEPFDSSLPSFLHHEHVQAYLEKYATKHNLTPLITLNTEVTSVRPRPRSPSSDGGSVVIPPGDYTVFHSKEGNGQMDTAANEDEPVWEVAYSTKTKGSSQAEANTAIYDAVVVCNGHFDIPFIPPIQGLDKFRGQILHSRNYDDADHLKGMKVLCIGYKSSGTDVAREVSLVAKEVHVVDRRVKAKDVKDVGGYERLGNVYRRPNLVTFRDDGHSVEFEDGSIVEIDAVMLCTGYCYHMPFLEGGVEGEGAWEKTKGVSGGARLLHIDDRAVHPTYQHLFHAYWPTLSFMGLLHSVVPFPMFELQAKWILEVLQGRAKLPSRQERFQWIEEEKTRQAALGRTTRQWHYKGDGQWEYFRMLAESGHYLTPEIDRGINFREEIYNDVYRIRPPFPGGPDTYRKAEYRVDLETGRWTVDDPPRTAAAASPALESK